jgi:hypothetical protein
MKVIGVSEILLSAAAKASTFSTLSPGDPDIFFGNPIKIRTG